MNLLASEDDVLSLDRIRATLIRLEDTIIFSLIERAQFAWNPKVYQPGAIQELNQVGHKGSWLDWLLKETESIHAKVRRFESPDEYPFFPREELSKPILPPLNYPRLLHPNDVNVNDKIKDFYIQKIVPAITARANTGKGRENKQDDGNYGSVACRDIDALQAISRRIHYGMFVSESKFRSAPADFIPHIYSRNTEELAALITKPAVEAALLKRLAKKAVFYGQELDASGNLKANLDQVEKENLRIDVEELVALYRDYIIPLTKEVEVEYLLVRLEGLSEEEITKLKNTPSQH